ncbi:MAG: fused MFS/spermidine synthase [Planctomycetaceae bacterium]
MTAEALTENSVTKTNASVRSWDFYVVLACFFLSGLAALLYQTVWMRQFSAVFGTSELAVATVLSAYMAGLAAGSWIAGRYLARQATGASPWVSGWLKRPILMYGVLEAGIALGALAVPFGMQLIQGLQVLALGGQPTLPDSGGLWQPLFYTASAFLLLLIPTACMGATLPLLSRFVVHHDEQLGRRVGFLYAINTLGAMVGTLIAAFWLMPTIGNSGTTWIGVLVNVAVFGLAIMLDRRGDSQAVAEATAPAKPAKGNDGLRTEWVAAIMFVSGGMSFIYEVLWTRLLGQVVGGSVYAFAIMLAAFLAGITLGSAIASPLARSRQAAWWGLMLSQLGAALTSLTIFSLLNDVPGWDLLKSETSLFQSSILCGCLLLPATLFIGATFPFAVRLVAQSPQDVGASSGAIYASNTLGGVVGSLLAGFHLIPWLGFAGTLKLAVCGNIALGVATLLLRPMDWVKRSAVIAALALLMLFIQPVQPENLLAVSPLLRHSADGKQLALRVGRSSTVRVCDWGGHFLIQNNGLPEALIARKGSPPQGIEVHHWLTGIPLLARPEAESLLVIGFGGGTAVEDIPESVSRIDVVELEPEVIAANHQLSALRDADPLSDPRIHVVTNDARGALALSSARYDIIVSQPSHPWTSGASHLYTQDFLLQAREHLGEEGVFLQWLDTQFLGTEQIQSIGATLLAVFPHVRLYQPSPTSLLFLGSDGEIHPEREAANPAGLLAKSPRKFERMPVGGVNDLAATLICDTEGLKEFCDSASPNTDSFNQLAFRSSVRSGDSTGASLRSLLEPYDLVLTSNSSLWNDDAIRPRLSPSVLVCRMCAAGHIQRAGRFAERQTEPGVREFLLALVARESGHQEHCRPFAVEAVRRNPQLTEARFLLCQLYADELMDFSAPREIVAQRQLLTGNEKLVFESYLSMQGGNTNPIQLNDALLERITADELTYPLALYCRASWRVAARRENSIKLATEAIQLTDNALIRSSRDFGFLIRCNAAHLAHAPQKQLESIRACAVNLAESDPLTNPLYQQRARVLARGLDLIDDNPELDPDAVRQVRDYVRQLSNSTSASSSSAILQTGFEH